MIHDRIGHSHQNHADMDAVSRREIADLRAKLARAEEALRAIQDDAGTHTISLPDVRHSGFGFIYRMAGFGLGLWPDPLAAPTEEANAPGK